MKNFKFKNNKHQKVMTGNILKRIVAIENELKALQHFLYTTSCQAQQNQDTNSNINIGIEHEMNKSTETNKAKRRKIIQKMFNQYRDLGYPAEAVEDLFVQFKDNSQIKKLY